MMSASTCADFLHMTEKFSYMQERGHPSLYCTLSLIMTLWPCITCYSHSMLGWPPHRKSSSYTYACTFTVLMCVDITVSITNACLNKGCFSPLTLHMHVGKWFL